MFKKIIADWQCFKLSMKIGPAAGYGHWDQVIEIQRELDTISGEFQNGYSTYANAYHRLKDIKKALHYGHKALEVNGNDFQILKILTEIYFKINLHNQAKDFARRALENKPKPISHDRTVSILNSILKFFSFLPKIRRGTESIEKSLTNSEIRDNKWLMWADEYVKKGIKTDNPTATDKQIEHWSGRFPDLDTEWTHWWIEGEGYCLGVVSSETISSATNLINENWKRFSSIYAHRAKMDNNGIPIKQKHRIEISNYKKNLQEYNPV